MKLYSMPDFNNLPIKNPKYYTNDQVDVDV